VQMKAQQNRTRHSGPIAVKLLGQLSLPNGKKPCMRILALMGV
jgi:hypothetical protein